MHNDLRRSSPVILSVLSAGKNMSDTSDRQSTTAYNDNWFDRLAINHLSSNLQAAAGSFLHLRTSMRSSTFIFYFQFEKEVMNIFLILSHDRISILRYFF